MKVLQLIDSLHAGGAERVAVNFANELVGKIDKSFICSTREEGILKNSISKNVDYLFLNKTRTIDFLAIKKINKYIRVNQIDILHAHSTSFFLATLIKLLNSNVKIVWHDHYGNSEFLDKRKSTILKFCSKYFSHVFCVNRNLEIWAKKYLKTIKVTYLPNFAVMESNKQETVLNGLEGKRVVCVANLRPQKNHFMLVKAFNEVVKKYPEWTLHCVGRNFEDDYAENLQKEVALLNLDNNVFFYGSKPDINYILNQCEIGVLSSKSEGLPVALLEYGLSKLAVIATKVGECEEVIGSIENGIVVNSEDYKQLSDAILLLIKDEQKRNQMSKSFYSKIYNEYSSEGVINNVVDIYSSLI